MKNAAKILFAEIEGVSPCRSCRRVDRAKEGIEEIQNRAFFRNEEPAAMENWGVFRTQRFVAMRVWIRCARESHVCL